MRCAAALVAGLVTTASAVVPRYSKQDVPDPKRFAPYLMYNVAEGSRMPLSYNVYPTDFYSTIPEGLTTKSFSNDTFIYSCQTSNVSKGGMVSAEKMNQYTADTERYLGTLGLDIYDGAVWSIASTLLGNTDAVSQYNEQILLESRTFQLQNIRGDAACKGDMGTGGCTDPTQSGACGICYGDQEKTLDKKSALLFRLIGDFWAIQGAPDARCPDTGALWTWNDYKPVLGENSWALFTGPLMHAAKKYGSASAIPETAPEFLLAVNAVDALFAMKLSIFDASKPGYGALYYVPNNVLNYPGSTNPNGGHTVSVENQASLLAGVRALHHVLSYKDSNYYDIRCKLADIISGLETFLLSAYNGEYFRQGGSYDAGSSVWQWEQAGQPSFAVDCQSWVITALGPKKIDAAFGANTTAKIYDNLKRLGGFGKTDDNMVKGFGFTNVPTPSFVSNASVDASPAVEVTLLTPFSSFNQADFIAKVSYAVGLQEQYVRIMNATASTAGNATVHLVFLREGSETARSIAARFVTYCATPGSKEGTYLQAGNGRFLEVFSAEWTLGVVNMLRVVAAESGYDTATTDQMIKEADHMRQAIESELLASTPVQSGYTAHPSMLYSGARYYIPFGWWANNVPSTASTGWAVAVDMGWNPLHLFGDYTSEYPAVQPAPRDCGGPAPPPPPTPPLPPPSPLPATLKAVLADLYQTTNGASWFAAGNWLDGLHPNPCGIPASPGSEFPYTDPWDGVVCNGDGVLIALSLANNNLQGTLPDSLMQLDTVVKISLQENKLSGSIPTGLGGLVSLQELDMSDNQLTGEVPASVVTLTQLSALRLSGNSLSGALPDLTALKSLQVLTIGSNQLTSLASGQDFSGYPNCDLSGNPFVCPIPQSAQTKCYAKCS